MHGICRVRLDDEGGTVGQSVEASGAGGAFLLFLYEGFDERRSGQPGHEHGFSSSDGRESRGGRREIVDLHGGGGDRVGERMDGVCYRCKDAEM